MRTVAIIQARMASTRLPGKVLADLTGRPLLGHVVQRASRTPGLDAVLVATSDSASDDPIEAFCRKERALCFRGSEDDVLDRYYNAASWAEAEAIVRLTADCPLLDPGVVGEIVSVFAGGTFDYASNTIAPTYPDGLDAEVFTRAALERAWREATLKSEREHVTPYIWKHPDQFRLYSVQQDPPMAGMRWTVDTPQDLEFVRRVYQRLGPAPDFGMQDVLRLLALEPDLAAINAGIERNEGYAKSLLEDGQVSAPNGGVLP